VIEAKLPVFRRTFQVTSVIFCAILFAADPENETSDVHLVGGLSPNEGFLQICKDDQCANVGIADVNEAVAGVTCFNLGYG
jgi:hypothetical protein